MTEVTQNDPTPVTRAGRSLAVLALIAVCLAAAAAGYFLEATRSLPGAGHVAPPPPVAAVQPPQAQPKPEPPKPPPAEQAQTQQAAAPNPAAPSVDVVRLDQSGALVMAGRAKPGETLTINSGVTILGTTTADSDGQWVFLPDAPLPSGVHQLSIADQKAAATDTAAQTTVLLSLPAQPGATAEASVPGKQLKAGPMVVLTQGNAPPRLLLAPPDSHPGPVGPDIVQYDDQGRIRFTGHAPAGKTVRLYVNNHVVGDATADEHGTWTLVPTTDLPPGVYQLRTDELGAGGAVVARSEMPFARASLNHSLAPGQAVVEPGDCLWTIARHSFGRGIVYTAIFAENRSQIRDPARIYPGQVFRLPTSDEAAHAPPPATIAQQHHHRFAHGTHGRHHERHTKRLAGGETSRS